MSEHPHAGAVHLGEVQEYFKKPLTPEQVLELAALARALRTSPGELDQLVAADLLRRLGLQPGGAA